MEKHSLSPVRSSVSTITTGIAVITTVALLSSCRTQYVPLPEVHSRDSLVTRVNTRVDSIFIDRYHTEKLHRGSDPTCSFEGTDTLVVRDSIYIERWRVNTRVDTVTIIKTDTVSVAIPCPSGGKGADRRERGYIPRFYIRCTIGFWLIIIGFLVYIAMRLYLRR